jgi:hypothetical protein
MTETTTVALRVPESVKSEWERATETDPAYDSLSHLVRLAVERELSDAAEGAGSAETGADAAVLASLRRLERGVADLQRELDAQAEERRAAALVDLERVALEVLSSEESLTAETVAQRIGADTGAVREALARLAETTATVEAVAGEETGYRRRG